MSSKYNYTVKFVKSFVNGSHLAGITVPAQVTFGTIEAATSYVGFLLGHTSEPVNAFGSSYTAHSIGIVAEDRE